MSFMLFIGPIISVAVAIIAAVVIISVIAAAIMEDPDIIILDEPINALDDSGTEQVRQILMKHKQKGALIIIACHDADELEFLSDEIIEIAEGKIQPKKDKKSNKQ